jgi:hypothetical protein
MRLTIESDSDLASCRARDSVKRQSGAKFLRVDLGRQERSRWCWAAIAVSLARFYETRVVSQRQLVTEVSGAQGVGAGGAKNVEARLLDALIAVGCYRHWTPGRPGRVRLRSEIHAGRPACVRIVWADSGASHFVLIDGFAGGGGRPDEIEVADPCGARGLHPLAHFPESYRGRKAFCSETYWTAGSLHNA